MTHKEPSIDAEMSYAGDEMYHYESTSELSDMYLNSVDPASG